MKKEFKRLQLRVINFEELDVIRTSEGGDTYYDNELPLVPFTNN